MQGQNVSVIILAGGFGTRMKSKTPKVLHKICGKEMLFCAIDEALCVSDDITIVLFNEAEKIESLLNEKYKNLSIHIQNHADFPGTAGAIMQGKSVESSLDSTNCNANYKTPKDFIRTRHDKVIITSGDMPLINAEILKNFSESVESSGCDIALGVMKLQDSSGYGRVVIESGEVKEIIEEKDANDAVKALKEANAGIYCFKKEILQKFIPQVQNDNKQREFYLTDVIFMAKNAGAKIMPVFGDESDFIGVNSKLDLSKAENLMLEKLRNLAMKNGVIMHLPQSIYVEFGVKFIGECEIESGVVLKGECEIENSKILANSVIESATIKDSTIGPMARIRPKSSLADSHIGNFVEVKASVLNGVKAGHLSYLGDSEIGSGTNVGAGVITCNYDGREKHKTIIGENVFIGSDSQLVAPLKIESNVLIASGSTVVKDAKDGDLVISRVRQENKANFFYAFFNKMKR